jgi:hypothetical protein
MGGTLFLVIAIVVWWGVWAHPATRTTCACGDPALLTWFLEWPAHAMANGMNPFHSTALFAPQGINQLANTSVLAIGVLLAPVTWLFGPFAAFNVALTLSPALSAFCMFVLLLRWTSWAPAAWIGALLFGFSPFVLTNLSAGHLMVGMLAVPPLIVLCLDELLVRRPRHPMRVGIVLGLLVVLQFFISTEVLVISAMAAIIGGVLVVGYAWWRERQRVLANARIAATGLVTAAITSAVLLAYPTFYALSGPSHFTGRLWPGLNLSAEVDRVQSFVTTIPQNIAGVFGTELNHLTGGYQGPVLSGQFVGWGAVAVIVFGLAAWHRDKRLWLFAAVGIWSVAMSLGMGKNILNSLPLLQDIVAQRYMLITDFSIAVLLGLTIDHSHYAVERTLHSQRSSSTLTETSSRTAIARWSATGAGLTLAAIALAQPIAYLSPTVPMTTVPVAVPDWFRTVAPHLPPHQILLAFPSPYAIESALSWQAFDGLRFDMVGGAGPGDVAARIGREAPGSAVLSYASEVVSPRVRETTGRDIANVRQAIKAWGVTMVVIPDQPDLPVYDQIGSVTSTAALIAAATGVAPIHQANAWVWRRVDYAPNPPALSASVLAKCIALLPSRGVTAVGASTHCVLTALASQPG